MKITTSVRHTIRFRRWSRKAYATFASIGHCVTIGNLPKSVADSSLSKQKATGSAGHTSCGKDSAWEGVTEGLKMFLQVLFGIPIIRPCVHADEKEMHFLKQRNSKSTNHQKTAGLLT